MSREFMKSLGRSSFVGSRRFLLASINRHTHPRRPNPYKAFTTFLAVSCYVRLGNGAAPVPAVPSPTGGAALRST